MRNCLALIDARRRITCTGSMTHAVDPAIGTRAERPPFDQMVGTNYSRLPPRGMVARPVLAVLLSISRDLLTAMDSLLPQHPGIVTVVSGPA